MRTQFTFIHGWGMDSGIWDKLAKYFPSEQSHFVDLWFIGAEHTPPNNPSIYITHSLGTLWALKYHTPNINALIAINSFTNFTNFVDERILLTMQKQLRRNPQALMNEFWQNIGLENPLDQNLNIDKLREGLDWLINWNEKAELNAPILSLAGKQDSLLPITQTKKEWAGTNLEVKEDGGHILPLSHPEWCADKIKGFLSEYKLEK